MFKKMVMASFVSTLGVLGYGSIAQAAIDGAYISGYLGAGTNKVGFNQNSSDPVFNVNAAALNATIINSPLINRSGKDMGFGQRAAVGFQFNPNFAVELGYTNFHNRGFTIYSDATRATKVFDLNFKQSAIDLVAKGIAPIDNDLSLFGTLGAAWVTTKANASYNGTNTSAPTYFNTTYGLTNANIFSNQTKIRPIFGIGLSYDINKNLPLTIVWQHIHKTGKNNDPIDMPSNDFFGIGLSYHFG